MTSAEEWQKLLPNLRKHYIGGDVVVRTPEEVVRGPASDFALKGKYLIISCAWAARLEYGDWVGINRPRVSHSIALEYVEPRRLPNGHFSIEGLGVHVTLYPKDAPNKLTRAMVRGLK